MRPRSGLDVRGPQRRSGPLGGSFAPRGQGPLARRVSLAGAGRELAGVLLGVVLPLALIGWLIHDLATPSPAKMPIPIAGSRTLTEPMTIALAVDQSRSMADSDPQDRRWNDVRLLGTWLDQYEQPGDMVAVIPFSQHAAAGPLRSGEDLARDPRGEVSVRGAATAFLPVAKRAADVFASRPDTRHILILVTDGAASDADQAIARFRQDAEATYVIALDSGDSWSDAQDVWQGTGLSISEVSTKQPNAVAAATARTLMRQTGQREGSA